MTTTIVHQGLDDSSKPSSRVLQPPGGGSSNIFGASSDLSRNENSKAYQRSTLLGDGTNVNVYEGSAPSKAPLPKETQSQSRLFGGPGAPAKEDESKPVQTRNSEFNPITGQTYSKERMGQNSPKVESPGAYNPITGEAYTLTANPDTGKGDQSSTRVRQPPGGKSTGLW